MKCFYPGCPVDVRQGGAVFRINAKGQPGIWACRKHVKNTDAPAIAPAVDKIVSIIQGFAPASEGVKS